MGTFKSLAGVPAGTVHHQHLLVPRAGQADAVDPGLGQGQHLAGIADPVGIPVHPHPELPVPGVARVEPAVTVAVEQLGQGLHVGLRRAVGMGPVAFGQVQGEVDLPALVDDPVRPGGAVGGQVEGQEAVGRRGRVGLRLHRRQPGQRLPIAVPVDIEQRRVLTQRHHTDRPVPVQIKKNRKTPAMGVWVVRSTQIPRAPVVGRPVRCLPVDIRGEIIVVIVATRFGVPSPTRRWWGRLVCLIGSFA